MYTGMNILAGSTLGGGTRVNWQASFHTPDHVRHEWAKEHGLTAVGSERYTAALDAVCRRLGVTTGGHPWSWLPFLLGVHTTGAPHHIAALSAACVCLGVMTDTSDNRP